jgi:hypothetical protein
MNKITVLALGHRVQWEDPTGDLHKLLLELVTQSSVNLIAEEAHKLPTTVGQRLAHQLGKPWMNIDMDDTERKDAGIDDELKNHPSEPRWKNGIMVSMEYYLPNADGIRETYWVKRLLQYQVQSALVLCGALHLSPFTIKLRAKGYVIEEVNACDLDWYRKRFGRYQIVEKDGDRWCEFF